MNKIKKNKNLYSRPSPQEMNDLESLYKSDQIDSLEAKVRKLVENYPRASGLYNILGIALQKKGKLNESISNFNQAINIQPNFDQAHNNLGNVLKDAGRVKEAIDSYEQALKLNPQYVETYSNLGIALGELGKFEEAIASHKKALKLNPNYMEAYSNLGNMLREIGKFKEAIVSYKQALTINPKYTLSNYNEALIRLTLEEFDIGWKKYEHRFGRGRASLMRYTNDKLWDGDYLDGNLLVWSEQGIGDHIIFASMLSDLRKFAKSITFEIDKRLINLFKRYCEKRNFSNIKIISLEKKVVNNFDKHIAIGSLGQYLRKSRKSFESTPNQYLVPSTLKEKQIRNKFFQNNKLKIGISWKTLNKKQPYRNIDLQQMLPVLSNSNCDFINLQFGKFDEEIKYFKLKHGINIRSINDIDNYNDIDGLAALINCLDLVITIQNTTAHLSGALGKKTWLMLAKNARWHWFLDKKKSLWYPSVKIFRQEKIGDWNKVINNISIELKSLNKAKKN